MTQAYPCLLSIGKSSKYKHFPFLEDQIKIGRSPETTYAILSATISRCHAVIEKQGDGTWTIIDNESLNGVSVNGKRLKALEPYTLQDGDIVQLGVPTTQDAPAEFVYRFFSSLKVKKDSSKKQKRTSSGSSGSPKRFKGHKELKRKMEESDKKAKHERSEQEKKPDMEQDSTKKDSLKKEFEEQLCILAQQLNEAEEEKLAVQKQLQQEREERQVIEEKQKQQEEKVCELDAKQRQLMKEKATAEEKMQHLMEEQLRERENMLRCQMQQQLISLAAEKSQIEERLQQEIEKTMQEKDRELHDRLCGEKERLQKIINAKELEQKALESQLAESRLENEKVMADILTTKEAIFSRFAETMETELQCSICNELFIKATSLNCSHAFCALCIRQWLAVKNECPNCRTAVTSQVRSIVLDNYIDRMVEHLSAELKQRHTQLVAERKEAERKLDKAKKNAKAGPSGNGRRRRGRTRGRRSSQTGSRSGGRAITASGTVGQQQTTTAVLQDVVHDASADITSANPINVSDTESTFDTDNEEERRQQLGRDYAWHLMGSMSSSENDEDGYGSDAYFADRYGRCSICGSARHWADECPH